MDNKENDTDDNTAVAKIENCREKGNVNIVDYILMQDAVNHISDAAPDNQRRCSPRKELVVLIAEHGKNNKDADDGRNGYKNPPPANHHAECCTAVFCIIEGQQTGNQRFRSNRLNVTDYKYFQELIDRGK